MEKSNLEKQFDTAMENIYITTKRDLGYNASRFINMLYEDGGVATANHLVSSGPSEGYTFLNQHGRLDLTVEALIMDEKWHPLFDSEIINSARERLIKYGFNA